MASNIALENPVPEKLINIENKEANKNTEEFARGSPSENKTRLGGYIPERFGLVNVYPDITTQPALIGCQMFTFPGGLPIPTEVDHGYTGYPPANKDITTSFYNLKPISSYTSQQYEESGAALLKKIKEGTVGLNSISIGKVTTNDVYDGASFFPYLRRDYPENYVYRRGSVYRNWVNEILPYSIFYNLILCLGIGSYTVADAYLAGSEFKGINITDGDFTIEPVSHMAEVGPNSRKRPYYSVPNFNLFRSYYNPDNIEDSRFSSHINFFNGEKFSKTIEDGTYNILNTETNRSAIDAVAYPDISNFYNKIVKKVIYSDEAGVDIPQNWNKAVTMGSGTTVFTIFNADQIPREHEVIVNIKFTDSVVDGDENKNASRDGTRLGNYEQLGVVEEQAYGSGSRDLYINGYYLIVVNLFFYFADAENNFIKRCKFTRGCAVKVDGIYQFKFNFSEYSTTAYAIKYGRTSPEDNIKKVQIVADCRMLEDDPNLSFEFEGVRDYRVKLKLLSVFTEKKGVDTLKGNITYLPIMTNQVTSVKDLTKFKIKYLRSRLIKIKKDQSNSSGYSFWYTLETRNPVHAILYILRKYINTDLLSIIDIDNFYDAQEYCNVQDITFDYSFEKPITVWEAINIICRVFRSTPVYHNGVLKLVRITRNAIASQVFNDFNIIKDSLTLSYNNDSKDDYDILKLNFYDPEAGEDKSILYDVTGATNADRANMRKVNNDSLSEYSKIRSVDLYGFSKPYYVEKEAKYINQVRVFRNSKISFSTGMEGMNLSYGDTILINHTLIGDKTPFEITNVTYGFTSGETSYYEIEFDREVPKEILNALTWNDFTSSDDQYATCYYNVINFENRVASNFKYNLTGNNKAYIRLRIDRDSNGNITKIYLYVNSLWVKFDDENKLLIVTSYVGTTYRKLLSLPMYYGDNMEKTKIHLFPTSDMNDSDAKAIVTRVSESGNGKFNVQAVLQTGEIDDI